MSPGKALFLAYEKSATQVKTNQQQLSLWLGDQSPHRGSAKLRSLNPRPRARRRPRPRSGGVFFSEESAIVPQLFCPVSLIVKHRDSRGRRTTTSTRTSPQCHVNPLSSCP